MGYFSNNKKMYIPLPIDTVEAEKGNYFFSNKKMFFALAAFLPIFVPLYFLMRLEVGIVSYIVVIGIYLFVYFQFSRFFIFEERRLRSMVKELDDNKVSGIEHFWKIDKIGGGKEDEGMKYYSIDGSRYGTTRGLVVTMDRGSTVGVPEGHFENFRKTKEAFLRRLHLAGLDVQWYEIQKKPELQKSIIDMANQLSDVEDGYYQKLVKLQLNINTNYSMDEKQRYVDYIVVKRERYSRDFIGVLESIVEETLGQNSYFVNPRIANKAEIEDFYKNYLMMDTVDSDNIRKSVDIKPFEKFAEVIRLVDADGVEVPIEYLDELDVEGTSARGQDIEEIIKREERKDESRKERNKMEYDKEVERLNKRRNRERITHTQYLEDAEMLRKIYEESDNFVEGLRQHRKASGKVKKEEKERKVVKDRQRDKNEPVLYEYVEEEEGEVEGTLEDLLRNRGTTEDKEDNEQDKGYGTIEEMLEEEEDK